MTFMIKTLKDAHICMRPIDNKNYNSNTKMDIREVDEFSQGRL